MSAGKVWPDSFDYLIYDAMCDRVLDEIGDRSDIGPTVTLWPSPQIPASVRSVEDSRIVDYVEAK